uniref:Insulin receptor substrate 1 n=1 Tax=Pyrrhocoris apterus TaxID=37000 RepID=A0AAU7B9W3_PYRAP
MQYVKRARVVCKTKLTNWVHSLLMPFRETFSLRSERFYVTIFRHSLKMSLSRTPVQQSSGEIVKQGCLRKLKTMRKKYFVLRGDTSDTAACIEYYDNEKKFRANQPPKRSITLKTCFNINKRTDTRHKWVVALYTKKDCFCIVFDNEEETEDWLKCLLELQLGEAIPQGEPVRPNFEHVWCVTVLSKELGSKKNILGPYLLCLTDTVLSLIKPSNDDRYEPLEFSLQKIRRCGHFDTFFYMELGQCTVTGPGNLWMQTEDCNIAENMHTTILSCSKKDQANQQQQPKSRVRSSSANEASKPTSLNQRSSHTGSIVGMSIGSVGNHQRTYSFPLSPVPPTRRASTGTRPTTSNRTANSVTSHFLGLSSGRERSDSMPSRNRTTSEGATHFSSSAHPRPHSMYSKCISCSPPINSSPVSPASVTCSTDSAGSSLSMDGDIPDAQWEDTRYGPSLTPEEPVIFEENSDDYAIWPGEDKNLNNYMQMDHAPTLNHSNITLNKKYSSNPANYSFKPSSPSQNSGLDLFSPLETSMNDPTGNYLPMSPGGDNRLLRNVPNHSRESSLTEDGYVPMAPAASDDGYVDMDHGANPNKQGSCGSITSGTPSTDIRFSEYPLDKVSTYFSPDEDITPSERPTRAYSVGSRPSPNVNRSELLSSQTCERVRAFSLGSRNVHSFCRIPPSSSHSSMEPCDDMMELDFSKKARRARKKANSSEKLSVPGGSASTLSSAASSYSTAEGSYMEMSPPRRGYGKSPPKSSPPGHPSPSLSRVPEGGEYVKAVEGSSYMEMRPGDPKHIVARNTKVRVDSFPRSSPPIKPALLSRNKDDYMDMSLKRKMSLTEDNNNTKVLAPQLDEYVEMNLGPKTDSDYMVMNIGRERRGSRKGDRSQPITIQGASKEQYSFSLATGGRKHSTGTPPKGLLPLSLNSSPRWNHKTTRRDDQGIFPFSPEGYEPSPKCPIDATSGEMKICNEEDDEADDSGHMDRFITGLGTMTIVDPKEEQRPSSSVVATSSTPNGRKELHYASLDLVKSGSESEESGRTVKTATESSSSPSPSLPTDNSPFNYAEIDFGKSGNKSLH